MLYIKRSNFLRLLSCNLFLLLLLLFSLLGPLEIVLELVPELCCLLGVFVHLLAAAALAAHRLARSLVTALFLILSVLRTKNKYKSLRKKINNKCIPVFHVYNSKIMRCHLVTLVRKNMLYISSIVNFCCIFKQVEL